MPTAPANEIELCYETFGDPNHPALEAFIAFSAERGAVFSSPWHDDWEAAADRAAATYDRAFYPEGAGRQLAALVDATISHITRRIGAGA